MPKNKSKGVYQEGNGWVGQYWHAGENVRRRFKRRDDAMRWRDACLAALEVGEAPPEASEFRQPTTPRPPAPRPSPQRAITVLAIALAYLEWFESEKPDVGYKWLTAVQSATTRFVIAWLGERDASTIRPADARAVRDKLRELGYARKSARDILARFYAVFDFAIYERLIEDGRNPFKNVKAHEPNPETRLTPAHKEPEYQTLFMTYEFSRALNAKVWRAALWFQRVLALRASEVMGIAVGEINWATGLVLIRAQGGDLFFERGTNREWERHRRVLRLKTEAGLRDLVIPSVLLEELRLMVAAVYGEDPIDGGIDPEAPVFISAIGKFPSTSAYHRAIRSCRKKLGLSEDEVEYLLSGHAFRKSGNTHLVYADPPLPDALRNAFMGHETTVSAMNSAVNARSYTLRLKGASPMQPIADFFDNEIVDQLGEDVELLGAAEGEASAEGMYTVAEAAHFLDLSAGATYQLLADGVLPSSRRTGNDGRQRIYVDPADVHAFQDARADIWTPQRASTEFGIRVKTILYWCSTGQVDAEQPTGRGYVIDEASLRARVAVWRENRIPSGAKPASIGLTPDRIGWSLKEAALQLRSTEAGVTQMVADGRLIACGDNPKRPRVTAESLEAEKNRLAGVGRSIVLVTGRGRRASA